MQPMNWIYAIFWLLAVPAAVGMALIWYTDKNKSICFSVVCGYAGLFAMAQMILVPGIFLKASLHTVVYIYQILSIAAAFAGIFLNRKNLKKVPSEIMSKIKCVKISEWMLFSIGVFLIFVQLVLSVCLVHQDADDSFYVASASTSVYTDTIFVYNPYTGLRYRRLPSRYVLSPFSMYEAVLTKIVGTDVPYMVYTILPVVLLSLAYLVYWLWAKLLFGDNRKQCALFLIFISMVQMFSNYSIYTSGTFLLMRIWQGKAVLAGVLLPATAYMCSRLAKEEKGGWPILLCLQLASCLVSSMGIILSLLMTGIYTFIYGICTRRWKYVGKAFFCCIPNLVFSVIYLLIR